MVKSVISTLIAGLYFIVPPFHVFLETHISSLPSSKETRGTSLSGMHS